MTDEYTNEELVYIYQKTRGKDILEKICQKNHGLVFIIVREFRNVYEIESRTKAAIIESDDIEQSAYCGLLQAVKEYDPDRGAPFSTVAALYIRGAILRDLNNTGHTIRVPVYKRMQLQRLKKFRSNFLSEYGRKPVQGEISAYLGLSAKKVDELLKDEIRLNIASLNAPVMYNEDETILGDIIPGATDPIEQIENEIQSEQIKENLWGIVDSLKPEQAAVIHRYYENGETLQEIGEGMQISGQKAAQIKQQALKVLRGDRCTKILKTLEFGYIKAEAVAYGGSLQSFERSGTSATEKAAFIRIEEKNNAAAALLRRGRFINECMNFSERQQYFKMLQRERRQKEKRHLERLKEDCK